MSRNLQKLLNFIKYIAQFVVLCAGSYIVLAILAWIAKEFLKPILQRLGDDTYEYLHDRFSGG
jgi:hypothetical protein